MKSPLVCAMVLALELVIAAPTDAQYIYLDVNGDGQCDSNDILTASVTRVDVYLSTAYDASGVAVVCRTGQDPMTLGGYAFILHSSGGVTYGNWADNLGFDQPVGGAEAGSDFWVARAGGAGFLPPGLYKLGTLPVCVSGTPTLSILAVDPNLDPLAFTGFLTDCPGNDFDNVFKLGSDFYSECGTAGVNLSRTTLNSRSIVEGPGSFAANTPPQVSAPSGAAVTEGGGILEFHVTVSDSDGDEITSLIAKDLGPLDGASFTIAPDNRSAVFHYEPIVGRGSIVAYHIAFIATDSQCATDSASTWIFVMPEPPPGIDSRIYWVPRAGDACQTYRVDWAAKDPNGATGTASTSIQVDCLTPTAARQAASVEGAVSGTPVVTAPASVTATVGEPLVILATATDPDGATLEMTADISQLSGAVFTSDRAPVVTAPASATGSVGVPLTVPVSALDPDGDGLAALTASGTAIAAGAIFAASADNATGTLTWTPSAPGSYAATFKSANALWDTTSTVITVQAGNQCPAVTAPPTQSVDEGTNLTVNVSATDPDGDSLVLTADGAPVGATFADHGDGSGTLSWTPDFSAAASSPYTTTFHASDGDGNCAASSASTQITVNNVNRAPTAIITAPTSGVVGVPVDLSGALSSDPDGNHLTYKWAYGDGSTGAGMEASHTYSSADGSPFTITLTVTDDDAMPLTDTATDAIAITPCLPGNVFVVGGNKTTNLGSGKPYTCLQVEPATGGSFSAYDVITSTVTLKRTDITRPPITADPKSAVDGDKDRNGIDEVAACFTKDDLRTLFAGLPSGVSLVPVEVDGTLVSGAMFCAPYSMTVKSNGAYLSATLTPNPFNPEAVLTFRTSKSGFVKVAMYDVSGRRVRSVLEQSLAAGYHDVRVDGRSTDGKRLASGVYYVKIETTTDGSLVMRAVIMK